MKNRTVKLMGGFAAIGLAAAIYSFTVNQEPNQPTTKKYEVIRMVDGELTKADTIINANSTYSPEDYLADLGFDQDENINILDLSNLNEFKLQHKENGSEKHKVIKMEVDEDISVNESGEENKQVFIKKEVQNGDETTSSNEQDVRIEKKIFKTNEGEEEVFINVESTSENINIDSMIQVAMEQEGVSDTAEVQIRKMIVSDQQFESQDGNIEWHEIDTTGATYHKEIDEPGRKMAIAVWGEDEDFTVLIVSDPTINNSTKAAGTVENKDKSEFKVFPNPSNENATIQLNFTNKAPTNITVTNMDGKKVMMLDLGNFKGEFKKELDTKKWSNGVYLIHVNHGNKKMIKKLIVR